MTGNAAEEGCAGPHLHYGLKRGGAWSLNYLNPNPYLYAVFVKDGKNGNDCRKKNVKNK